MNFTAPDKQDDVASNSPQDRAVEHAMGQLTAEILVDCFRRLERPLYNIVYRMVWSPSLTQDIVQEAFLKVWSARSRVDAGSVDAFIYKTALNLSKNQLRWRRYWNQVTLDDHQGDFAAGDDPEQAAMSAHEAAVLHAALARLPAKQKEVVLLSEFSELSLAQVGEILGIPPGTVASRRHTALQRLREFLGDHK